MEFHEKLLELRTERKLTQEELAAALYVSRTAVSKWESGRGYPNIESLKAIAKFFSVTIDALLSDEEIRRVSEDTKDDKCANRRNKWMGWLDCSFILFVLLPCFGQNVDGNALGTFLIKLTQVQPWLKWLYGAVIIIHVLMGAVALLAPKFSGRLKNMSSLAGSVIAAVLFIVSRQPYAGLMAFSLLIAKLFVLFQCPDTKRITM